ncbi:MAG: 50S ribosomal protein L9 [Alphaproteobacteria bacterium]
MQVILLERIERLGQMGDVVNVKPGFARNFLLPQRKALRATDSNRALFETQRAQLEAVNLKRRQEAEAVAGPLDGMTVTLIRQASDMGQLYGSVTSRDISEAVTANGVTVARSQIVLNRPIKTLGLHQIRVVLHPEVAVEVTANVARTEDEAAIQLERGTAVLGVEQFEEEAEDEAIAEEPAEPAAEEATEAGAAED